MDRNTDFADYFAVAPKLRAVDLSYFWSYHTLNLPWSQLTEYNGEFRSFADALAVLAQAPLLVKCTFRPTIKYSSSLSPSAPRLRLLYLRELSVTAMRYPDYPGDLLNHLELPSLNTLHVAWFDLNPNEETVMAPISSITLFHSSRGLPVLFAHLGFTEEGLTILTYAAFCGSHPAYRH